jgi:hypothetical protein
MAPRGSKTSFPKPTISTLRTCRKITTVVATVRPASIRNLHTLFTLRRIMLDSASCRNFKWDHNYELFKTKTHQQEITSQHLEKIIHLRWIFVYYSVTEKFNLILLHAVLGNEWNVYPLFLFCFHPVAKIGLENREHSHGDLPCWPLHPLSAKLGTNFTNKWQSLGRYSLFAD